ncbi:peptide chain release factor N(5)-glutamine methyltransferase [Aureimonas mangrovi]|uniref:peptide chain release factor N(5)-glutamine methyltransferase n=1 Tax=Aureimonas mangrovi TaxID=2758041 RepID=UPI00163D6A48|nr:peptide chain release factor N(5)-glutamine methyltransferase [Aureimonas mangrovi]
MPDDAARPSLGEILRMARERLRAAGGATPDLDVELLAREAFAATRAELRLRAAETPNSDTLAVFEALLARREAREPVHRILGRRAFYDHEFALSPETLEPRPDTEALVELAARALRESDKDAPLIADLGTGSGAIAVSLLALFPKARCIAVDLSPGALVTARSNSQDAGVASRFWPVAADYLAPIADRLDLVVSNPPYIPTSDILRLDRDVREFDPHLALDGGEDGLDAYRAIARQLSGSTFGVPDVLFEIGAGQLQDVCAIMEDAGWALHEVAADLGGVERALWFRPLGADQLP